MYETLKVTEYLNYTLIGDTGKTKIVGVGNNSGAKLGKISWSGAWRKYVFHPIVEAQFDVKCLTDIITFINELMEERK